MRYSLHFITPVYVGSGLKLGKMDYVTKGSQVLVMNLQRLASLPGVDPEELSDAMDMRNFEIGAYLRDKRIDPSRAASYSIGCSTSPLGEISCCLKDGLGNPYIPGSSIKGALRTAILWERIKRDSGLMEEARLKVISSIQRAGPRNAAAWAAQPLERLFMGKDPVKGNHPNYDHLRALKVSDSTIISKEKLQLFEVAVKNLKNDCLETKMSLWVEAFKPGTEAEISLDIDPFLLRDDVKSKLNLEVDDLKDLQKIVKPYYSDYINGEIDYFSNYGQLGLAEFYRKLLSLANKEGGMLLRTGWGSGWHGMTVARLFPELIPEIREAFQLGRQNVSEFPKTRKLAVVDNNLQPLGWIWARPM
jgi:CRISPR-associated protein Csm5